MRIERCRYYGIEEQGVWALLLVVVVVQIACGFGSRGDAAKGNSPQLAITQLQDGTMLAKR